MSDIITNLGKVFEEDWDGEVIGSNTFEWEYQSNLPSVEEVMEEKRRKLMNVKVRSVPDYEWKKVRSLLEYGDGEDVYVNICQISGEEAGYIPSKVWYDNGFKLLFYMNDSMPDEIRPFSDETYLMYFKLEVDKVLKYDIDIRMFMDQIMTDIGMVYFCVFGKSNYKLIIGEGE